MFLFAFIIIEDAGAHRIRFHANAEHSAQADFLRLRANKPFLANLVYFPIFSLRSWDLARTVVTLPNNWAQIFFLAAMCHCNDKQGSRPSARFGFGLNGITIEIVLRPMIA